LPGQPGIWPSPGYPSHPIAPGGPPPVVGWVPPGTVPGQPISGGGYIVAWSPVYGWVVLPIGGATPPQPGEPTHPMAPGGGPSQGPGLPTQPIAGPPTPEPKK
jgi:hypothetical protein